MRLKIGVIGHGTWGRKLRSTLAGLDRCEVVAIADPAGVSYMPEQNLPDDWQLYADYRQMIQTLKLNAVVIATPPETHEQILWDCIEMGLSCYVEKPMALATRSVEALVSFAQAHSAIVKIGYLYRNNRGVHQIRTAIDTGLIGSPVAVVSRRTGWGRFNRNTSVLADLAGHDLSILFQLFPGISFGKGYAESGPTLLGSVPIEANAFLVSETHNLEVQINVSWGSFDKVRSFRIFGLQGIIEWSETNDKQRIRVLSFPANSGGIEDALEAALNFPTSDSTWRDFEVVGTETTLEASLNHFFDMVEAGKQDTTLLEEAAEVDNILAALEKSRNHLPLLGEG